MLHVAFGLENLQESAYGGIGWRGVWEAIHNLVYRESLRAVPQDIHDLYLSMRERFL